MRPDFKLGLIVSMVSVFVAGSYFFLRGESETPIEVASGPSGPADSGVADRQPSSSTGSASRESGRRPVAQRGKTATPTTQPRTQVQGQRLPAAGRRTTGAPMSGTQANKQRPNRSGAVAQRNRTQGQRARGTRPPVKRRPKPQLALTGAKAPANGKVTGLNTSAGDAAVEKHRVQNGDTLSSLASQYYGAARFARFLADNNPQITDPAHLRAGEVVKIPPRPSDGPRRQQSATTRAARPPANEPRTYRVKSGDSFYKISRDVLGDASRWRELFELNKDLVGGDPTHLQVGQLVKLPRP